MRLSFGLVDKLVPPTTSINGCCVENQGLSKQKNKKPLGFKFRPLSVTHLTIAFSKMNL